MRSALLLTSIPSPYMTELVDEVNNLGSWEITVLYQKMKGVDRHWAPKKINHKHTFLDHSNSELIEDFVSRADLIILGSLWGSKVSNLIKLSISLNKPFVLWAEKPGAIHRNFFARLVRNTLIFYRFKKAKAVWGIGEWAVRDYKRILFGVSQFANMPYASNLKPYFKILRNDKSSCTLSHPIRFLFSGSLISRKGVDLLIPIFIKLINEGLDISLTLIGKGELIGDLNELVYKSKVDKITFLGFKDWDELSLVYANHDILIAPSRYDGWGLIVVEALASGIPVITTNMVGAGRDLINQGKNGWIIPANNSKALEEAIRKAVKAPLAQMGIDARFSVSSCGLDDLAFRWCKLANKAVLKDTR